MFLAPQEQKQINELVAEVEAATSAQVLAAVVGKSDTYPEIPWKAFAAGAALAALAVMLQDWMRPDWTGAQPLLTGLTVVLGTGAALGLMTIFIPPFARLFLDRLRADSEVRQYAQCMFMEHGLFRTRQRSGVLVLISRFEHEVVILPDEGISSSVPESELAAVITHMTPLLARGETAEALCEGLRGLKALLLARGHGSGGDGDEIAATLVQEKGA
jgi:putative membrane protein